MNRFLKTFALTAPLLAAALVTPRAAEACGGAFAPTSTTLVSGHRMALSISKERTVLWDQVRYEGNPEDFSWVLPIKPGARIEQADNAWFETLEAATLTTVEAPPLNCGQGGTSPFGCGSSASFAGAESGDGADNGGVQVIKQETVGPYESVTLSSEDPGALTAWLESHGYDIPEDVKPIISAYVEEGFDFIALRLTPGNGVDLMSPVRVITQGATPVLPLRMVSAGTGPFTSVVLYLIGEGRWTTDNFPEARVRLEDLVWDGEKNDSNYAQLRQSALAQNAGRSWITTYARGDAFFGWNIAYSYVGQVVDESAENYDAVYACNDKLGQALQQSGIVVDPCAPDGGDVEECATLEDGQIDARDFTCEGLTDLSAALVGMRPRDVWVTRMEANLPRSALLDDLVLRAHDSQSAVDNYHFAEESKNYQCPSSPWLGAPPQKPPSGNGTLFVVVGLGALATMLVARRRFAGGPARA